MCVRSSLLKFGPVGGGVEFGFFCSLLGEDNWGGCESFFLSLSSVAKGLPGGSCEFLLYSYIPRWKGKFVVLTR